MCPPDYFTVDYVINPWMAGHESSLDIDLAKRQWQLLRDTIDEYAEIVEMEPQPGLPDLVFTANAGTVYGAAARRGALQEMVSRQWFRITGP
jgi:N-dimethylarginine dimethylaminohydrolase